MPLKVKVNGVWTDVKGVFVKGAGTWYGERMSIKINGIWVDVNVQTIQYPAIKTRSFNDGWYEDSDTFIYYYNKWQNDTGLGQGGYDTTHYDYGWLPAHEGPFYGTIFFGSGAGKPTELSSKSIISSRIYLKRYSDSPGSDSAVAITIYATTLSDVPGAGATSPHGEVSGGGTVLGSLLKGQGKWFALPSSLTAQVIAGKCLCLYNGNNNLSRHYGIEDAGKPQIEISYF